MGEAPNLGIHLPSVGFLSCLEGANFVSLWKVC